MIGIKDFGMPSCCVNCQMCDAYEKGMCVITDTECEDMYSKRNADCPLVEITESDDCVSRADLMEMIELMTDIKGNTVYVVRDSDIRKMPSVQPKRGGDKE